MAFSGVSVEKPLKNIGAYELVRVDCTHCGTLRKKGFIAKVFSRIKWSSVYAVLTKRYLYIFDDEYSKRYSSIYILADFESVRHDLEDNVCSCFHIKYSDPKKEALFFGCTTDKVRNEWLTHLRKAIKDSKDSGISVTSVTSTSSAISDTDVCTYEEQIHKHPGYDSIDDDKVIETENVGGKVYSMVGTVNSGPVSGFLHVSGNKSNSVTNKPVTRAPVQESTSSTGQSTSVGPRSNSFLDVQGANETHQMTNLKEFVSGNEDQKKIVHRKNETHTALVDELTNRVANRSLKQGTTTSLVGPDSVHKKVTISSDTKVKPQLTPKPNVNRKCSTLPTRGRTDQTNRREGTMGYPCTNTLLCSESTGYYAEPLYENKKDAIQANTENEDNTTPKVLGDHLYQNREELGTQSKPLVSECDSDESDDRIYENLGQVQFEKETYIIEGTATRKEITTLCTSFVCVYLVDPGKNSRKMKTREVGTFCVYWSEEKSSNKCFYDKFKDGYVVSEVLAVVTSLGMKFCEIHGKVGHFYLIKEHMFASIEVLIDHYGNHPFSYQAMQVNLVKGINYNQNK